MELKTYMCLGTPTQKARAHYDYLVEFHVPYIEDRNSASNGIRLSDTFIYTEHYPGKKRLREKKFDDNEQFDAQCSKAPQNDNCV